MNTPNEDSSLIVLTPLSLKLLCKSKTESQRKLLLCFSLTTMLSFVNKACILHLEVRNPVRRCISLATKTQMRIAHFTLLLCRQYWTRFQKARSLSRNSLVLLSKALPRRSHSEHTLSHKRQHIIRLLLWGDHTTCQLLIFLHLLPFQCSD